MTLHLSQVSQKPLSKILNNHFTVDKPVKFDLITQSFITFRTRIYILNLGGSHIMTHPPPCFTAEMCSFFSLLSKRNV